MNTIVKTVKNLPTILSDVAEKLQEFVKKVYSIAGSTILEEIKIIIQHVKNFVDGVKQDIMKFYNVSQFHLKTCSLSTIQYKTEMFVINLIALHILGRESKDNSGTVF